MMKTAEITFKFNLDKDRDKRIYQGLNNLPKQFGEDLSEAFLLFFDSMILSLSECEEQKERYEKLLLQIISVKNRKQRYGTV
jgi:hypothetical protein